MFLENTRFDIRVKYGIKDQRNWNMICNIINWNLSEFKDELPLLGMKKRVNIRLLDLSDEHRFDSDDQIYYDHPMGFKGVFQTEEILNILSRTLRVIGQIFKDILEKERVVVGEKYISNIVEGIITNEFQKNEELRTIPLLEDKTLKFCSYLNKDKRSFLVEIVVYDGEDIETRFDVLRVSPGFMVLDEIRACKVKRFRNFIEITSSDWLFFILRFSYKSNKVRYTGSKPLLIEEVFIDRY